MFVIISLPFSSLFFIAAPQAYAPGSSLPSPIVKFSLDDDLAPEECHSLLTEHMPDRIQMTKVTQRLFIK